MSDKPMPMEPTQAMIDAAAALPCFQQIDSWCSEMQAARGREACWKGQESPLVQAYKAMLAAYKEK